MRQPRPVDRARRAGADAGGLTYLQVIALIEGIRRKATLAGFDMVEFVPERDPAGTAAYVARRIVRYAVAQMIRQAARGSSGSRC